MTELDKLWAWIDKLLKQYEGGDCIHSNEACGDRECRDCYIDQIIKHIKDNYILTEKK